MADSILASGKSADYRHATEVLHREQGADDRHHANYRMLWECGFADLIRRDYYGLFEFSAATAGHLLEAGCGTGVEAVNLQRLAPGLTAHGVDISSVALVEAVRRPDKAAATFHQAALEQLPFVDSAFDIVSSHEVVEHVEDPAVVLREFHRVLKPGGVCVIATPNGASLWADQLRQRVYRLFGRRGAPVGQDHTRPPSFWRREFARVGLVLERQIFDGAALEFQTYFAKASWMHRISRTLEPLRAVPFVNLLLCDRVKFRLRKPGDATHPLRQVTPCCPLCFSALADHGAVAVCGRGHRFARGEAGVIDFTAEAAASGGAVVESAGTKHDGGAEAATAISAQAPVDWRRRARRAALFVFGCGYAAMLLALAPLGLAVGAFYQPFDETR